MVGRYYRWYIFNKSHHIETKQNQIDPIGFYSAEGAYNHPAFSFRKARVSSTPDQPLGHDTGYYFIIPDGYYRFPGK